MIATVRRREAIEFFWTGIVSNSIKGLAGDECRSTRFGGRSSRPVSLTELTVSFTTSRILRSSFEPILSRAAIEGPMQAETSVSDYHESGKLSWVSRQSAGLGRKKPEVVILDSQSARMKLKPGLY
jgi:hypothetical protein